MANHLQVACIQTCATADIASNVATVVPLIGEAAAAGAALICLSENVTMIEPDRTQAVAKARPESEHPGLAAFCQVARETGVWVLAGSLAVPADDRHIFNRSLLIDGSGQVVARYDKIHLFDVNLSSGESYQESAHVTPGEQAVIAPTPWGRLGMTICYDVRFAALYRALAQGGADLIAVPAAFTVPTGQAHWEVLLRARAIETGCFVLAPAQCGTHAQGRRTYGHAMIIDPWGQVVAEAGDEPTILHATLDLSAVAEARRRIPSLRHDRHFRAPDPLL